MNTKISPDDLIAKYLCGEATPEEAMELEAWKSASTENLAYFQAAEQTLILVDQSQPPQINSNEAWQKFFVKSFHQKNYRRYYTIAALFTMGLLAVLMLFKPTDKAALIIAGQKEVIQMLPDSSLIRLALNSNLAYANGFGKTNRQVTLTGKADFTVIHHTNLPFIIDAKGVYVEDLGTVFTVDNQPDSDTLVLIVQEGMVRLYDDHGSELIVKAGEKAWYIRSDKKIISQAETKVVSFDFKDRRLEEVISLLRETYDTHIELSPVEIGECKITTRFFDEDVATIITVITETMGFTYQYHNHHYIIEGKPCR